MINHALAELWTGQENHALLMHDWYLALLATAFGKLIYIDQPTELYRQHSSNVLGARTLRKRVKNWVRPHILFAKYWNLIESSQEQAKNLLDLPVSSQTKEIIENFVIKGLVLLFGAVGGVFLPQGFGVVDLFGLLVRLPLKKDGHRQK